MPAWFGPFNSGGLDFAGSHRHCVRRVPPYSFYESLNIDRPVGWINRFTQLIVVGRLPSVATGGVRVDRDGHANDCACRHGKANLADGVELAG